MSVRASRFSRLDFSWAGCGDVGGRNVMRAPPELDPAVLPGATIVGRHEQRVFGIRMVTHDYWFRPVQAV